jgi:hypothetical protein
MDTEVAPVFFFRCYSSKKEMAGLLRVAWCPGRVHLDHFFYLFVPERWPMHQMSQNAGYFRAGHGQLQKCVSKSIL